MSEAIGPGRLILIVGPSGAGKDTLIALARDEFRDDRKFIFPRRAVTRPSSEAEDHDTLTGAEFELALEHKKFALAWDAHGLKYGVPVSIDDDLAAGRTVVCNVSRAIVAEARSRYRRTLAVLVTAPAKVLESRLAARRREGGEGVAARLSRTSALAGELKPDFTISNAGRPEDAAKQLIEIIRRGRAALDFPAELLF